MQEVLGTNAGQAKEMCDDLDMAAQLQRLRHPHGIPCPESMKARKEQWYYVKCANCSRTGWIFSQGDPEKQPLLFCIFGCGRAAETCTVRILHRAIDIWPDEE